MISLMLVCLVGLVVAMLQSQGALGATGPVVVRAGRQPAVEFAVDEIRRAVEAGGGTCVRQELEATGEGGAGLRFVLGGSGEEAQCMAGRLGVAGPENLAPQGFAIRRKADGAGMTYAILATDAPGAMYGGLEVAEAIRLGTLGQMADREHVPYIARRGIKFNIPLDARTPSYSDASDAAQQNIPEMWSRDFWRDFLEEMARHRFNVLSLWNLHPFPSLVKVPEFPAVALDDVLRTKVRFDSTYSHMGHDMVRPEHLANLEVVKRITIDQKIAFWREVMQYAHDRGIEVYVLTWNIFTFGADGKHGITHEQDNPQTIAYFRASVRELIRTYPLLAGIGITAGERMSDRPGAPDKEQWLWSAYGEGVRDGLREAPNRAFRVIHRCHMTGLEPILQTWQNLPCAFDLSYKYSVAHMYSSPAPVFARELLDAMPAGVRTWMTVRNDDIYNFRWGDPDFARDFVRALPGPEQLAGYYMGPDGYTWGREFVSTEPEQPRELVLQKQWFSFLLWGRLSYDPALPNAFFQQILAQRFPQADAATLFETMQAAGKIIPQVNRFYWQDIDLKWFPEACLSHPTYRGFHTVRHFVEGQSMPGAGAMSIGEFVRQTLRHEAMDGQTPPEVVAALQGHANAALRALEKLGDPQGKELRLTLGDQRAMALLGLYYAAKIAGALELGFYNATGDGVRKDAAVRHLQEAVERWQAYAAAATKQYRPQLLTRVGYVDLIALTEKVQQDVQIAQQWERRGG